MIRILLTLIVIGVILLVSFYQFKERPLKKRMLVAGSISAAALTASILQFLNFAFYIPLLAIIAISLAGAIVYAKLDEAEKAEKLLIAEERKQKREKGRSETVGSIDIAKVSVTEKSASTEESSEKLYAMQTIGAGREER